jgi:hypothetical protein
VLHFVGPQNDPFKVVDRYRRKLAPGSWIAISHIACDDAPPEAADMVERFLGAYRSTSNPGWLRSRDEILPFFGDWSLLEPGLVHLGEWRWDGGPMTNTEKNAQSFAWCGVAEKPR